MSNAVNDLVAAMAKGRTVRRVCSWCWADYYSTTRRDFCSRECALAANNEWQQEDPAELAVGFFSRRRTLRKCRGCGDAFWPSGQNWSRKAFCSVECRRSHYQTLIKAKRAERTAEIVRQCPGCWNDFTPDTADSGIARSRAGPLWKTANGPTEGRLSPNGPAATAANSSSPGHGSNGIAPRSAGRSTNGDSGLHNHGEGVGAVSLAPQSQNPERVFDD